MDSVDHPEDTASTKKSSRKSHALRVAIVVLRSRLVRPPLNRLHKLGQNFNSLPIVAQGRSNNKASSPKAGEMHTKSQKASENANPFKTKGRELHLHDERCTKSQ